MNALAVTQATAPQAVRAMVPPVIAVAVARETLAVRSPPALVTVVAKPPPAPT